MLLHIKSRAELTGYIGRMRVLGDAQLADALLTRFDASERVDDLIAAASKARAAEIDACACRTRSDWRRYHEAADRLAELRSELLDLAAE